MRISNLISWMIITTCIFIGIIAINFLIKGLKEDKIFHIALAGNVLIVASTISSLCWAMML